MLDVGKLATLRAVIAHRSFSAAGVELALTQPAVSRQVALLERQAGTALVTRTRHGVFATEAGRVLVEHTDALLARLALAEEQLAELAGLRRGRVRLGSFFTALVYLSAEAGGILGERHPDLVIEDQLVDRATAIERLTAGRLDVALVFEEDFAPDPVPAEVELIPMFVDPVRVLLPTSHPLCARRSVRLADLAHETWVRAHDGSAAGLVDHVLRRGRLDPPIVLAGHGDEPVEAQALVAAGKAVALAYDLNVIVNRERVTVRPLAGETPARTIQATIMRDQRAPAARALLDALRELGRARAQAASRSKARTAS